MSQILKRVFFLEGRQTFLEGFSLRNSSSQPLSILLSISSNLSIDREDAGLDFGGLCHLHPTQGPKHVEGGHLFKLDSLQAPSELVTIGLDRSLQLDYLLCEGLNLLQPLEGGSVVELQLEHLLDCRLATVEVLFLEHLQHVDQSTEHAVGLP